MDRSPADNETTAGLQPERTTLAWTRTGLSATAAALILLRVAITRNSLVGAVITSVVAVLALSGVAHGALGHGERKRRFDTHLPASGLSLIARLNVAAAVGLCAAGALLVAAD